MSLHGRGLSVHAMRRILVNTENDPEVDPREYEDVKIELRSTGHNLVSRFFLSSYQIPF